MKALKPLHAVRVENPACPGTPDINYNHGWIEDKWLPRWPRKGEVVRLEHFTPQQRVWHERRHRAGGRSFVALQVEREYFLFDGLVAARKLGYVTEEGLHELALGYWERTIKDDELIALLLAEK